MYFTICDPTILVERVKELGVTEWIRNFFALSELGTVIDIFFGNLNEILLVLFSF